MAQAFGLGGRTFVGDQAEGLAFADPGGDIECWVFSVVINGKNASILAFFKVAFVENTKPSRLFSARIVAFSGGQPRNGLSHPQTQCKW